MHAPTKSILATLGWTAVLTLFAGGATIVSYDFATDANPTSELANTSSSAVTGTGWTSGGSPSSGRSSSSFSFYGRGPSNVALTSYIEFTVDAAPTYGISLTSLSFNYHISQSSGPASNYTFETRSSLDGYASEIAGSYSTNPDTSNGSSIADETASFDLSGGSYDNLDAITFRFYVTGDDTPNFGDIARFDNFLVEGAVAPIPEPSVALLGVIGALLLLRRRRD